jgi:copper chaperone
MIAFRANDMTCGHCTSDTTKAVEAARKGAKSTIEICKQMGTVEPIEAGAEVPRDANTGPGCMPLPVEEVARDASAGRLSFRGSSYRGSSYV